MARLIGSAGRPYGHVPGHSYLDVEVYRRKRDYHMIISWGSTQGRGCDEEHGRVEYAGSSIEDLRSTALGEEDGEERRRLIHTACAEAGVKRAPGRPVADDAKGARLVVRLSADERHALEQAAAEAGETISAFARRAVLVAAKR